MRRHMSLHSSGSSCSTRMRRRRFSTFLLSDYHCLSTLGQILAMDDGTFPALLKTLSDTPEEVIKHDLRLFAQISSASDDSYFKAFMINLLDLFSADRRLLETRGSLIFDNSASISA